MEKSELLEVLDAGLNQSRITEEQYKMAMAPYRKISDYRITPQKTVYNRKGVILQQ